MGLLDHFQSAKNLPRLNFGYLCFFPDFSTILDSNIQTKQVLEILRSEGTLYMRQTLLCQKIMKKVKFNFETREVQSIVKVL